jgi:hypothetical protein
VEKEYIILEGKDYDKLIAEGMQHLKVKKEELNIEVLESRKNLFSCYYKLKLTKSNDKTLQIIENSIDNILNENQNAKDKSIDFDFREDGVYIKVESGVTMVDIVTKIDLRRILSVDLTKIKQMLQIGSFNNWIKIAEPQEEKKIDSECTVKISKDNMQAYITITKPIGGEDITENTILEALKLSDVVLNIKDNEIRNAVVRKIYGKEILIAEGIEPQAGIDAVLTYHFDISIEKSINIDKDGKIDFHELSLIKNVNTGDKLVTLTPHTEGTPGKNVMGEEVPGKDGKKLSLPRGKNVDVSELSLIHI